MSELFQQLRRTPNWLIGAAFVISIMFAMWALSGGWSHPIVDAHGFRQTQTAISVRALLAGGPLLAYETPVLGAPWAIPFEFPLYQWTVAVVSTSIGLGIDQAGRVVSIVAYLATFVPIWYLLGKLRVPQVMRLVFLSLYLVSPIYAFWSRTVMIESLALFLALAFLALVVRYLDDRSTPILVLASLAGVLAGMVKVTTLVPFLLLALGAFALDGWRRRDAGYRDTIVSLMPGLLAALVVPVAATLAWTRFADATKAKNAIGRAFTSSELREWNLGTLEQRFDLQTWGTVDDRLSLMIGGGLVLAAAAIAVVVTNRYRAEFVGSVAVGLTTFLIFTNLHYVHDYYQYAIGLFLIAAVGFGIVALMEETSILRWAGYALLAVAMLSSMLSYTTRYRPVVDTPSDTFAQLAELVESTTEADEVVVVIGAGWTSEIAYLSDRRAVMISSASPSTETVVVVTEGLDRNDIGAMVVCSDAQQNPLFSEWADVLQMQLVETSSADGCDVHLRTGL